MNARDIRSFFWAVALLIVLPFQFQQQLAAATAAGGRQVPIPSPPPPPPPDWPRHSSLGILNATRSCAGVDPTGTVDVTRALQACIEAAYTANQALFLAPGRYLVSDTLTVAQADGGPITPYSPAPAPVNIVPCRFRANVLLGSTVALPSRPTIVLQAHSLGFNDSSKPRNVMKITNPHAENIVRHSRHAPISSRTFLCSSVFLRIAPMCVGAPMR